MSFGVLARSPAAEASVVGTRIPAAALRLLRSAEQTLQVAELRAVQMAEHAEAKVATAVAEGRAAGLALGRAEAIASLLGTLVVEHRLRELLATRLADLVVHCVRTVLQEAGEDRVLRGRIAQLLTEARSRGAVTLHVAPSEQAQVEAVWQGAHGRGADQALDVSIVADPTCSRGAMRLETPAGFVEADLPLAIEQWQAVVEASLQQAAQTLEPSR